MTNNHDIKEPQQKMPPQPQASTFTSKLFKGLVMLILSLSAIWLVGVFWTHLQDHHLLRWVVCAVVVFVSLITLITYGFKMPFYSRWLAGYGLFCIVVVTWFLTLQPQQYRDWMPEVAKTLSYTKNESDPNLFNLHNVRNFDWKRVEDAPKLVQPTKPTFESVGGGSRMAQVATERWVDRQIDLSQLDGIDVINSYWRGESIAHTLVSFRFKDDRPITFSYEIRKEQGEGFSAVGGFFRKFELSLIASEERDIVYMRSNARGEQVYIFPISGISQDEMKALFLEYLNSATKLHHNPKWYNTLISNCTNIIYYKAQQASWRRMPLDYRIWLSGYVPNYLYDIGLISSENHQDKNELASTLSDVKSSSNQGWSINEWYINAHVNPKVVDLSDTANQDSTIYSQLIRQNLPVMQIK